MSIYKVWAVQVLTDVQEIEADSLKEARATAQRMYQETGELDPSDIADGDCGVIGYDEWSFEITLKGGL